MYWILDAHGEPIPTEDVSIWAEWFQRTQGTGERIIAHDRDEAPGAPDVLVSTVFLGLDHNFTLNGPPVLYETLVMGGPLDGEMMRFTSKADALDGHREMCARVAAATIAPSDK